MPSHQWAVSTLIREVLADPDLARRVCSVVCFRSGRGGLVDAEAAAVIGAQRHVAHPGAHQQAQRHEAQEARHHRRGGGVGHPQAAHRIVLPLPAPPPPPGGQGPARGGLLRPESRGCPPARPGDLVKALGNESGISRSAVSRIRDGHRRGRARVPHPAAYVFARRHLPGRDSGLPGGLSGPGGGHRRVGPRGAGRIPEHGPSRGRRDHRFEGRSFLRSLRERGLKVPSPHDPEGVVLDYR